MRAESGRAVFRPGPLAALVLLALGLLLLLTVAAPAGAQTGTNDYDTDDNGLIEIDSQAKLEAVRYDLNGDGLRGTVSTADWNANYDTTGAFDDPRSDQCPASTCTGYELDGNLTLTGTWTPIGASTTNAYTATFDGQGHTITGLSVDSSAFWLGLFGVLGSGAVVRDVGLTSPSITSQSAGTTLGGLAGIADGGSAIDSSYVEGGTITAGGGTSYLGGLAGVAEGTIRASYSTATLTNAAGCSACNTQDAGGLVGELDGGTITASYAAGANSVSGGTGHDLGGFVGRVSDAAARINNSYCDSSVAGFVACVGARDTGLTASNTAPGSQSNTNLQSPTNYAGIYRAWNLDLDSDNTPDNPWQFRTASQYPSPAPRRSGRPWSAIMTAMTTASSTSTPPPSSSPSAKTSTATATPPPTLMPTLSPAAGPTPATGWAARRAPAPATN